MTESQRIVDPDTVADFVGERLDGSASRRAHLVGRERLVRAAEGDLGARTGARGLWLGGGVLALAAAAAVTWFVWPSRAVVVPSETSPVAAAPSGALVGEWIQAPSRGVSALDVGRGAALALHDGARGRVALVDDARVVVVLEAGHLAAEVDPKANRKVAVEAGPYTVAVVGTEFRVDWEPESGELAVAVTHGKVQVTTPASSGPIAVDAGHRLVVDDGGTLSLLAIEGVAADAEADDEPVIEAAIEPAIAAPSVRPKPRTPKDEPVTAPTWQSLAKAGKYEAAITAIDAGFDGALASLAVGDLELLADAARLAGRTAKAEAAYLALRKRFAGTTAAAHAAFQLGRQSSGAAAVKWLKLYLDEAPQGSFAKLARGRLIGALTDAGERRAAVDAARVYLDSYPDGPHAKVARALLESSSSP